MKRRIETLTVLVAFAISASSVEAIIIKTAEVQSGVAIIEGRDAERKATITWEGSNVTQANNGGNFQFVGVVPLDCVGTLSDGADSIKVALLNCTSSAVYKTGQTICYDSSGNVISCTGTGQDGDIQAGAPLPTPRFTDNNNGTFTDRATGLIWLKNANCFGLRTWTQAFLSVNNLTNGQCGLTDGSSASDWRIPNIREIFSLVDFSRHTPALPFDHLFNGFVGNSSYWSSTTSVRDTSEAWTVDFNRGTTFIDGKTDLSLGDYIIAVRGP